MLIVILTVVFLTVYYPTDYLPYYLLFTSLPTLVIAIIITLIRFLQKRSLPDGLLRNYLSIFGYSFIGYLIGVAALFTVSFFGVFLSHGIYNLLYVLGIIRSEYWLEGVTYKIFIIYAALMQFIVQIYIQRQFLLDSELGISKGDEGSVYQYTR
ncbi:MAG: hypothetical protein GC205_01470 [Bacteroidetes bacterium]|nr:hypothetical protein [Bacteroidota bacterium]